MEGELRALGEEAVRRLDAAIAGGAGVAHAEIRHAVLAVVAVRDRAAALHGDGSEERTVLDAANALVSLAYGAQFPLAGVHIDRLERTRDGMRALLDPAAD